MAVQGFLCIGGGFVGGGAGACATWHIREKDPEAIQRAFNDCYVKFDQFYPFNLTPDCRSMLLTVPIGRCLTGCGMVTVPDFTGWRKCWWLPLMRASTQPSASIVLKISALFSCVSIHIPVEKSPGVGLAERWGGLIHREWMRFWLRG